MFAELEYFGKIDDVDHVQDDNIYYIILYEEKDQQYDSDNTGGFDYPRSLMPTLGQHQSARYWITCKFTYKQQEIRHEIKSKVSINEHQAKLDRVSNSFCIFNIYSINGGQPIGVLQVPTKHLPEIPDETDNTYYITVRVEYDHELTKEETGYSEERFKRMREER